MGRGCYRWGQGAVGGNRVLYLGGETVLQVGRGCPG